MTTQVEIKIDNVKAGVGKSCSVCELCKGAVKKSLSFWGRHALNIQKLTRPQSAHSGLAIRPSVSVSCAWGRC